MHKLFGNVDIAMKMKTKQTNELPHQDPQDPQIWKKYLLHFFNHFHIWQVSSQLSYIDTCQIMNVVFNR